MTEFSEIWSQASTLLRGLLNKEIYDRWMADIVPLRIDAGNVAVLGVANDMFSDWLNQNYGEIICEKLGEVTGSAFKVRFEVCQAARPAVKAQPKAEANAPTAKVTPAVGKLLGGSGENGMAFNPRYAFDNFVVGDCNQYAYGVCTAVASAPGMAYNPVFIHSGSGMGKTHLLYAIAQEVLRQHPRAIVEYVTTEDFSNRYVMALKNNTLPEFRQKIRQVDVLLMDDIQFLKDKARFQEEVFHTFNALHQAHKQIVITADRPQNEIEGLEDRLVSRFEWGLTADIQAPDFETRLAILRKRQDGMKVKLSDEVLGFVAEKLKSSIRRLEGALLNLVMHSELHKRTMTTDWARELLEMTIEEEASVHVTAEQIQRAVAEYYDIRFADMTSKRRPANIALPRQIAMYLTRRLTSQSYPEIAQQFDRTHATVMHAYETIHERVTKELGFARDIRALEHRLGIH